MVLLTIMTCGGRSPVISRQGNGRPYRAVIEHSEQAKAVGSAEIGGRCASDGRRASAFLPTVRAHVRLHTRTRASTHTGPL